MKPFAIFALVMSAAIPLVADDAAPADLAAPKQAEPGALPPPVGRYQLSEVGNFQILVDTATGRIWRVERRGIDVALTPVFYEHPEGATALTPEYTPPPEEPPLVREIDPEQEADRQMMAREFVSVTISDPIMSYASSIGEFPPSLAALTVNLGQSRNWKGPYLRESPIDPWGARYRYKYPGENNTETYDVWSLGPDGVPSADDIGNW